MLAVMFATLFNSYSSVCLRECFFPASLHCKIAKEKKQAFQIAKEKKQALNKRQKKNFNRLHTATGLYDFEIAAILLANTKKSLKFYRFESVHILVSFIDLSFVFVSVWFILLPRLAFFKYVLKF